MVRTFGSLDRPAESAMTNPVVLDFSLAGSDHVYQAFPPTGGQMLITAAAMEMQKSTSGMVQFLMSVLSDEDFTIMRDRLLDREDTLDLDALGDLFTWMLEEWGRTPTAGRSGSSASPVANGRTSTAKRRSTART